MTEDENEIRLVKNPFIRVCLLIAGWISLILGFIGIFLPVLPTTPFLLLSAACFIRSSKPFYRWLVNHKLLGKYIQYYLDGEGLPKKAKYYTVAMIWTGISISAFIVWPKHYLVIMLFCIATAVSIYILRLPTRELHQD